MVRPVIAIPVKPFGVAKRRLSSALSPSSRTALGRALADHAVRAVSACHAIPLVLSADGDVTQWARSNGTDVLLDEGSSLDRAASLAVRWALDRDLPWAVLHADLPLLTATALRPVVSAMLDGRSVIGPSSDGGTSLLGSRAPFRFSYGPGSFRRHLASLARLEPMIVTSTALALDLDEPVDLQAAMSHPDGRWLAQIVPVDTVP